jgi:uncharacterized membrane protein
MSKEQYLNTLKSMLREYTMTETEISDIISDYSDMWDEYLIKELDEDEIVLKLGPLKTVVSDLTVEYKKKKTVKAKKKQSINNKLVAISPFVALPLFFLLSFLANIPFEITWLSFLIIPMSAIALNTSWNKPLNVLIPLSPFLSLIFYFAVLGPLGYYNPGWVIFFLIPALGGLKERPIWKMMILEGLLLGGVFGYVYLFNQGLYPGYRFLVFAPIILYVIIDNLKNIVIEIDMKRKEIIIVIVILASYFLSGFFVLYQGRPIWAINWLVFLIVPVYTILRDQSVKDKLVPISPFVATTLFMLLGFFFGVWAWAWLVFLIIPVTAILKDA